MTAKPQLAIDQHWRTHLDGYVVRIVGFDSRGWPVVRHVNAKSCGYSVNPAWFEKWVQTK